ncbi:hypothetical protein A5711_02190 [Mycobacterium sp. E2238]|nr:hypothetical protein A5711_02190 [Mycobacterium sp. E2238]
MGKALAEAVVEEVLELAKARLGDNVGKGLLKFLKTLKKPDSQDLRRTLRMQSDNNVVRLLVRMADEVAVVAGRDVVITLDEGNRLSEDDQRILASIAVQPAKRARIVIAWSTAEIESLPGLTRLRKLGLAEVQVSGLSCEEVERWLAAAGMSKHSDDVWSLTAGYPLLVEGLVAHLRSGGRIDRYSAPTLFNDVLHDALSRLPTEAHHAARKLSAFSYPLAEAEIPSFLGIDVVAWGIVRAALERERVFSVEYPDGTWFHEARRSYLWGSVLSAAERNQVGQAAYSKLLDQHRRTDATGGLYRRISALAPYALESQAQNPTLASIIRMDGDHLAVLAAAVELQNTGLGSPTPADQVVIHAHTAFGADRRKALDALPELEELGVIGLIEIRDRSLTTVDLLLDSECDVVARGRVQEVLRKSAVPHLAEHVVRAHLERVRLESYAMVAQTGEADALDVIANANMVRAPVTFRRVGDPLLGIWLRFGDQPVTVVGVFNSTAERLAAEREITNLAGTSFGRQVMVDRMFEDPTHTVASLRFLRAVYFATGLNVNSDGREYWLDGPNPLPMEEFAQRQVDLFELLRSETDQLEREVYGLTQPVGVAIARHDKSEYRLEVRGAAHVYPMDFGTVQEILADGTLISARIETALGLPPTVTMKHLTTQTWRENRTQDPVVELLGSLRKQAERFNVRQPLSKVHLETSRLKRQLTEAHIRDQRLARRLSETITIGGERGHRPSRALHLAIHTHGPNSRPDQRAAVCAWPPGDPEDVRLKYVSDESVGSAEAFFKAAYGPEANMTDLHAGMLPQLLASLLGFEEDEIEAVR